MSTKPSIPTRTVWFHRQYHRMQGGHLIHAHYYADTAQLPGFAAALTFTPAPNAEPDTASQIARLWPESPGTWAPRWQPSEQDILFLAGQDWSYLYHQSLENLPNPRLNLIQHVRHGQPDTVLRSYLRHKAIRICVSQEVADAIHQAPELNGPVVVIPNGCDLPLRTRSRHRATAPAMRAITIIGYKNPDLATAVAQQLDSRQLDCTLMNRMVPRDVFLDQLRASDIVLCIPRQEEGFYLPALEAMNLGCLVITADCIGNRGFCVHEQNCLMAEYNPEAFVNATLNALNLQSVQSDRLLSAAQDTARAHTLDAQRAKFHDVLRNIDQLW